ncbi:hypothetical protein [Bacillus sp. Marseille-Q3570]|uniref:hypothetical protein n=1 Tax=Bacillus sp. Marseille-Q3570 TaxID=2963522 RepID=UPI0021B71227|nr:hypothetical protein [Bacillus sp. Marseille-Q3570]
MRESHFWIAIMLVVILWTGNYTYLLSKQLDEPIFLKHYYEVWLEDRMPLEFYYLTNKSDHGTVNSISINGIHLYTTQDGFMFYSEGPQFKEEYIHQHLKSFKVDFPEEQIPVKKRSEDEWIFTEFIPSFNNGGAFNHPVEIGYVNFRGDGQQESPFKFQMSGSSSYHRSQYNMSAEETLLIEEIKVPLLDRFPGVVEVKIQDSKVKLPEKEEQEISDTINVSWDKVPGTTLQELELPLELKSGDWISIHTMVDERNTMFLRFNIWLKGKSSGGKTFEIPIQIQDEPNLDQYDINDIISRQEGGGTR